ncbi:MAG: hypothetical protein WD208_13565 [Dehalococcoidia bacterium]
MPQGVEIQINAVPDPELMGSGSVEVYERAGRPTTYRLRYPVGINDDGDLTMLSEARFDPGSEVSILVPIGGTQECLVKGPVRGQSMHLDHAAAASWVEVLGSDTTVAMDRENKVTVWADMTDSDVASNILASHGYAPDVHSTSTGHAEDRHALVQRDTDLGLLRRLARRNGFHFWVTCDDSGMETAHFRPAVLDGGSIVFLSINQEMPNINALDIQWDVERPTSVESTELDARAGSDINGATTSSGARVLGAANLQAITGDVRSTRLTAPVDDAGDLTSRSAAVLGEAEWFVQANTSTTLARLGALVRLHTLANVSGIGSRHSGDYYVTGVRHLVDSSQHRMEIELSRNGWNI